MRYRQLKFHLLKFIFPMSIAREPFRKHSYFSDIAAGVICGLGAMGYELALQAAHQQITSQET